MKCFPISWPYEHGRPRRLPWRRGEVQMSAVQALGFALFGVHLFAAGWLVRGLFERVQKNRSSEGE